MSSNVSQSYPYSSETEAERAAAVAKAFADNEGLEDTVAGATTPLADPGPAENGASVKWWTWVCPACIVGRLHIAGYSRDRHGLFTLCDACGETFTR